MQKQQSSLLRVVAGTVGALALGAAGAFFGIGAYASAKLNKRPATPAGPGYDFSPFETQVDSFEDVEFQTEDGIQLKGWWFSRPESQRLIVCFGGHHSKKTDMLGIGSGLWRAGNNVLLFDWRSRGTSQIAQHSLAYYELRDAQAAVSYAQQRMPDAKLGIVGFSMGAAVAILHTAQNPAVRALLADSPFTTISELVADRAVQLGIPPSLVVPAANTVTSLRYGYTFEEVRPLDAIRNISPRPLLLVHGDADSVIPVEHAHKMFEVAREPKELWIVPGAEHCGAYFDNRAFYVKRAAEFFEQYLDSIE